MNKQEKQKRKLEGEQFHVTELLRDMIATQYLMIGGRVYRHSDNMSDTIVSNPSRLKTLYNLIHLHWLSLEYESNQTRIVLTSIGKTAAALVKNKESK